MSHKIAKITNPIRFVISQTWEWRELGGRASWGGGRLVVGERVGREGHKRAGADE